MIARHIDLIRLAPIALAVSLVVASAPVLAQAAGEVEFSRGVGFAQTPGQVPRTLGKGLPLREGDRLTTSDGASAIIKLDDGTRMTVRPNSELVIQQYQFKENADNNTMLMQLVRGGFRAVTGLIAKGSPNAARVQTNTATIGIRGTDFDARICAKDCAAESARITEKPASNQPQASAKLAGVRGEVNVLDAGGQRRRLVDGGSVYPGDLVETSNNTNAVLVFRDDSKITLGSTTRFRVDNFVFDNKNPGEGRFLVSLLRGSARALTGLIGKANTRNVAYSTSTATIGIRGSGVDMNCTGACAGDIPTGDNDGLSVFAWLGTITMTPNTPGGAPDSNALQVLQAGQGLFISASGIRSLGTPPPAPEPRPDGFVAPPRLFSTENVPADEEGLFVFVRDGHIEIVSKGEILQLGRGEAGQAGNNGVGRPPVIPPFLNFDTLPLPSSRNPGLLSALSDAGIRVPSSCPKL